ncbi:MAG: hypothetical protein R6U58_04680 [Bacteroidales bacterium]
MHIRSLTAILLFTIGFTYSGSAQYGNDIYYSDTEIAGADSGSLFFRFGNATFINNKEFFNPYQPGYTLTGYFIRPQLEYYPGTRTKLLAGMHLLHYSGQGKYHQAIPVFTFHHRFSRGLQMVAGSLYGTLNHDLIEPLFAFDRVFTHHNESGLQFLVDNDFLEADVWLNWEKFIFTGSPFREEFIAGFSSKVLTGSSEGRFRVALPLQLLATHKGGQIDASGERLQTLVNFAAGVVMDWHVEGEVIEMVGFRGYMTGFKDLSKEFQYPYENGWGIYPNIFVKGRWLEGGVGYWRGNQFVAPRGEPLFQSVSPVNPDIAADHRELLTSKIIFNRNLLRGINMGVRFEVYYDLPAGQFDHSGGLHIVVDERFFITKPEER